MFLGPRTHARLHWWGSDCGVFTVSLSVSSAKSSILALSEAVLTIPDSERRKLGTRGAGDLSPG